MRMLELIAVTQLAHVVRFYPNAFLYQLYCEYTFCEREYA
jgi:hypothetical protein